MKYHRVEAFYLTPNQIEGLEKFLLKRVLVIKSGIDKIDTIDEILYEVLEHVHKGSSL